MWLSVPDFPRALVKVVIYLESIIVENITKVPELSVSRKVFYCAPPEHETMHNCLFASPRGEIAWQ